MAKPRVSSVRRLNGASRRLLSLTFVCLAAALTAAASLPDLGGKSRLPGYGGVPTGLLLDGGFDTSVDAAEVAVAEPWRVFLEPAPGSFLRPISFTEHSGPEPFSLVGRTRGYTVGFLTGGIHIITAFPHTRAVYVWAMAFEGGSTEAVPEGREEGARDGADGFREVWYEGLYEGVDARFRSDSGGVVEYDFILRPLADPTQIRIRLYGVDQASVAANGDLVLQTPVGELRQRAPNAYQTFAGHQVEVASSYRISEDGLVSFDIAPYDRSLPLVIDPEELLSRAAPLERLTAPRRSR